MSPCGDKPFFIEKKDGTQIGFILSWDIMPGTLNGQELGYALIPGERCKGCCTEAVDLMLDFSFLSKAIVRVQAHVNVKNTASQRVLEKAGFQREGGSPQGNICMGRMVRRFHLQHSQRWVEGAKSADDRLRHYVCCSGVTQNLAHEKEC